MSIKYDSDEQTIKLKGCKTLLEACLKNKIDISHSCEAMASCGTCRVIVTHGLDSLPPRSALEEEMAKNRNYTPKERLACQTPIDSDFSFILPGDSD